MRCPRPVWYSPRPLPRPCLNAQVAQLVEQRTENPRVGGSIPSLGTTNLPPPLVTVSPITARNAPRTLLAAFPAWDIRASWEVFEFPVFSLAFLFSFSLV